MTSSAAQTSPASPLISSPSLHAVRASLSRAVCYGARRKSHFIALLPQRGIQLPLYTVHWEYLNTVTCLGTTNWRGKEKRWNIQRFLQGKQDAFSVVFRLYPICLFILYKFKQQATADYSFIVTFLPLKKILKNPNENIVKRQGKYLLQHPPIPHTHTLEGKNRIRMQTSCLVHSCLSAICLPGLQPGL